MTGFIDHLHVYTRPEIISNCSAAANLHNLQITTASSKPFPACCVFTSRSLATASNSKDSSASRTQVFSSQTPVQYWLCRPNSFQDNSSARTTWEHTVSKSTFIVVRRSFVAGTCLPRRCPETDLVYPPISWSLHSNGSTRYNTFSSSSSCLSVAAGKCLLSRFLAILHDYGSQAPCHNNNNNLHVTCSQLKII
jgi:hypothetical protein